MRKKKIDFASILIILVLIIAIGAVGTFLYYCVVNSLGDTMEQVVKQIGNGDSQTEGKEQSQDGNNTTDYSNVTNPLDSVNPTTGGQVTSNKTNYYYNQMDSNAKKIYDMLSRNVENMKTGTYVLEFGDAFNELLNTEGGSEVLNKAFQVALDGFSLDKPEVFYLDPSKMILMMYSRKTILKTTYTVSIKSEEGATYLADGFSSKEDVDYATMMVEGARDSVLKALSGDTVNQIKQIHDCIIDNLEYDQTQCATHTRNIYGSLIEKNVVCEGYAKVFKYLADGIGLPSMIVVGTATNSDNQTESHAWNYVKINEKWYAIDTTWDDPIVVGGGKLSKKEKTKYFLKGSDTFNKNHLPTGITSERGMQFTYPELSKEDY